MVDFYAVAGILVGKTRLYYLFLKGIGYSAGSGSLTSGSEPIARCLRMLPDKPARQIGWKTFAEYGQVTMREGSFPDDIPSGRYLLQTF